MCGGGGECEGESDRDGDDDRALRQLSQDQVRLSLVRSLYSASVSPEQTLWTPWLLPAQRKTLDPFFTSTEQILQGSI